RRTEMPNDSRIDTQWLSPGKKSQHVMMTRKKSKKARGRLKYLADIACAANVIATTNEDCRLTRPVDRLAVRIVTIAPQFLNIGQRVSTIPSVRALEDIGDGSRCHGHRPSISKTSVQPRKVRTNTRPASRPRLMKDNSCAMVFTISAATRTSRPSRSDRPMRILYISVFSPGIDRRRCR